MNCGFALSRSLCGFFQGVAHGVPLRSKRNDKERSAVLRIVFANFCGGQVGFHARKGRFGRWWQAIP
ncbi:hypothetical protein RV420_90012 [Roseovarius sp. EC-SD190]|nr:hypothetical protein RV420_90012 [Roseovarius sp. EC-SD190]